MTYKIDSEAAQIIQKSVIVKLKVNYMSTFTLKSSEFVF